MANDVSPGSRGVGKVSITSGNITTNSTTFVDLTGATVTIITNGGRVLLSLIGVAWNSVAGNGLYVDFAVDGVNQGGTAGLESWAAPGNSFEFPTNMTLLTDVLAPGQHTFKVQWRVSAGTGTYRASSVSPIILSAVELGVH